MTIRRSELYTALDKRHVAHHAADTQDPAAAPGHDISLTRIMTDGRIFTEEHKYVFTVEYQTRSHNHNRPHHDTPMHSAPEHLSTAPAGPILSPRNYASLNPLHRRAHA